MVHIVEVKVKTLLRFLPALVRNIGQASEKESISSQIVISVIMLLT